MRSGDFAGARECCVHVLAFLEVVLQHVPWHPALSLERYQLAQLESALGDAARGYSLVQQCMSQLLITHGLHHRLQKTRTEGKKLRGTPATVPKTGFFSSFAR